MIILPAGRQGIQDNLERGSRKIWQNEGKVFAALHVPHTLFKPSPGKPSALPPVFPSHS